MLNIFEHITKSNFEIPDYMFKLYNRVFFLLKYKGIELGPW